MVLYPGEKEQLVTDDEILASVEVVDQSPKAGGIGVEHIGGTAEGLLAPLNVEGVRDRLRKTVSKAYKSLRYEDVKTFNFLFLASDAYVFDVRLETLAEAIYGTERITHYPTVDETKVVASLKPNGIWSENVYSKLDAIFYFKPNTDWLGADFDPIIFPNPVKIEKLRTVPQPFNSMKCSLPKLVFGPKEL